MIIFLQTSNCGYKLCSPKIFKFIRKIRNEKVSGCGFVLAWDFEIGSVGFGGDQSSSSYDIR